MKVEQADVELDWIRVLARRFRAAMDSIDFTDTQWLSRFPVEACDITCKLLGLYLHEHGVRDFAIMRGKRPADEHGSHQWLQLGDVVIDIQARTPFGSQSRCSLGRQSDGQRRRWESNPLEPGCSRWPCRLAPASGFQCPRQELNLVCDLRTVACDPAHSEDKLAESREQDNTLRRLSQSSAPRSSLSASPLLQRPGSTHRMASFGSSLP